jgi:two-component system NtrC family sensor kinase
VSPDPAASNRLEALRWLKLAIVLAAVLPLAFFVAAAYFDYRSTVKNAEARSQQAAQIAEEHASRVFVMHDVISRQVLHSLAKASDTQIREQEAMLHGQIKNLAEGLTHIQAITVWNPAGKLLVTSSVFPAPSALDISDREHFRIHRSRRDSLLISEVQQSRSTGEPAIDLSTRRTLPDGSFGGVVATAVSPGHFAGFYRTLESAEPGLSIALLREDGHLLARWPAASAVSKLDPAGVTMTALLAGSPEGMLDARSAVDGLRRIGAFRKVGSHPLYIVAGIDHSRILAAWQRRTVLLAAFHPAGIACARLRLLDRPAPHPARTACVRAAEAGVGIPLQGGGGAAPGAEAGGARAVDRGRRSRLQQSADGGGQQSAAVVETRAADSRQSPDVRDRPRVIGGTRLTRQLLAFSRRQAVTPHVISINDAVPAMLDLLRTSLGSSIRLQFFAHAPSAFVRVDAAEFELALLNLALNARDAMQKGGELTIATRTASLAGQSADLQPGEYVVVTVTDTGPGVPEALLARVFEPFFTTKKPGQGTGLGLSQVYGFCLQAGGIARMVSKPHTGTVVSLFLPAAAAPTQVPAASHGTTLDGTLRGRLLLVEDNLDVAAAIKPLLEALGCAVRHVPSADDALKALDGEGGQFDVVLSDILMPGSLNGFDLAMMLRHRNPELPVLLMTGYAEKTGQAMASGFQILAKPVSAASLAKAIGGALGASKSRRAAATS